METYRELHILNLGHQLELLKIDRNRLQKTAYVYGYLYTIQAKYDDALVDHLISKVDLNYPNTSIMNLIELYNE